MTGLYSLVSFILTILFNMERAVCKLMVLAIVVQAVMGYTYPSNEYEYSFRRDALKDAEIQFEGGKPTLSKVK